MSRPLTGIRLFVAMFLALTAGQVFVIAIAAIRWGVGIFHDDHVLTVIAVWAFLFNPLAAAYNLPNLGDERPKKNNGE